MGNEVLEFLNDKRSVKILVNVDDDLAHLTVKSSLKNDGEDIVYTEFIESSNINRHMTKAIWFDKNVSILLITHKGCNFKITAKPTRAIVSGKIFQQYYDEVQKEFGDFDLSTVWILKPLSITDFFAFG
jgi:monomeric isocitrate dehydrogenase